MPDLRGRPRRLGRRQPALRLRRRLLQLRGLDGAGHCRLRCRLTAVVTTVDVRAGERVVMSCGFRIAREQVRTARRFPLFRLRGTVRGVPGGAASGSLVGKTESPERVRGVAGARVRCAVRRRQGVGSAGVPPQQLLLAGLPPVVPVSAAAVIGRVALRLPTLRREAQTAPCQLRPLDIALCIRIIRDRRGRRRALLPLQLLLQLKITTRQHRVFPAVRIICHGDRGRKLTCAILVALCRVHCIIEAVEHAGGGTGRAHVAEVAAPGGRPLGSSELRVEDPNVGLHLVIGQITTSQQVSRLRRCLPLRRRSTTDHWHCRGQYAAAALCAQTGIARRWLASTTVNHGAWVRAPSRQRRPGREP